VLFRRTAATVTVGPVALATGRSACGQAGLQQLAVRPTRTILLYLLPPFTVAKAANTSTAKPIHRITVGNISLSIFPGSKASLQRQYVYKGLASYANSIRAVDVIDAKKALDQFAIWDSEHPSEATPQKEAEPAAA
jgi:hypothetical protein